MSWLKKAIPPKIKNILGKVKKNIPEGLWQKCPSCQTVLYGTDLEKNNYVCPNCDFHHRINARKRINLLLDTPDQIELGKDIKPTDPLSFKDSKPYKDRIKSSQKQTDENDALITVKGHLESLDVVIACFEFKFMGGSMVPLLEKSCRSSQCRPLSLNALLFVSHQAEEQGCKRVCYLCFRWQKLVLP